MDKSVLGLMLPVLAAGCASVSIPVDRLHDSQAAVARAQAAGAVELAPRELALAREKLGLAERWIAAKDYEPARWLLEQVRVDADLAAAKASRAAMERR